MFEIVDNRTDKVIGRFNDFDIAAAHYLDIIGTDPDLYNKYWQQIDESDWDAFAEAMLYDMPDFYTIYDTEE